MPEKELHEALFWKKEKDGRIKCNACQRNCIIGEGKTGFCRVRKNIEGKLYSLVYGKTLTLEVDPIEKKPLFHFKPGSQCTGVSTYGCNFACLHCQNFHLSQKFTEEMIEKVPFTSPKEIVERTLELGVQGIAYTYTEPTIFIEYALDTMKEAKKFGLYNVFVSNGYMSEELLQAAKPYLDAINVDLKGNQKFYQEVCGGVKEEGVKNTIRWLYKNRIHNEVTYLIIPGFNDKEEYFKETAEFILSLSDSIPLHFSRFYPMNKLDYLPATDPKTVFKAKEIAENLGLKYVYAGNLQAEENTLCPKCKNLLVERYHYNTEMPGIKEGKCSKCGSKAEIIF